MLLLRVETEIISKNRERGDRVYFFPALTFVHLALFAALIRARPAAEM